MALMTNKLRNKITLTNSIANPFRHLPSLLVVAFALQTYTQPVSAQKRYPANQFQGSWRWEYHLTDEDFRDSDIEQLKRWAEGMDIRKAPYESLQIELIQRGDTIQGKCSSAMRFIEKQDGGAFRSKIKGGVAEFKVESSHGGTVRVRLRRLGNKLHWKIIKSEGEGDYWFPDKAILHRTRAAVKRRAA
jgi:hypothetical protein